VASGMIGLIRSTILRPNKPLKFYLVWLDGQPWQGAYYGNLDRARLYANAIVKEKERGEVLREWRLFRKGHLV
jgi:hypothetical protein